MMKKNGFSRCAEMYIGRLRKEGRYSTAHVYENALLSFRGFCGTPTVSFGQVTREHLRCYGQYLYERGLKLNTVSTYMRMLRSIYNRGVESGRAPYVHRLFHGVYTGVDVRQKKALPATELHKLLYGDPKSDILRRTQAIAALMFQFCGMSFADLAHLEKSSLDRNVLHYNRVKTKTPMSVEILDTAKAVAYYEDIAVVCVPTAASTDAPCSALSVLYTDDGQFDEYLWLPANPDIILLDTDIIVAAPVRLIVSGMGDALATYFETRACMRSNTTSCMGGSVSKTAMALSELCFKTLMEDGAKALLAVNAGACTPAVENIIEANTYLSGIGFESGGIAAAHAIHNGLTCIEETHGMYHGEKVAFGVLSQLVLENVSTEDLEEVVEFCINIGLPVTFEELGIKKLDEEKLMEAATLACAEGDTAHNMPFEVTPESVYNAMLAADRIGHYYKDYE